MRVPSRRIAFASGKGGTGKTLLATSTAWVAARGAHDRVVYVDTDVEEPNGHLFLRPEGVVETRFTTPLPTPVPGRCTGCRLCQIHCAFHAILVAGRRVMVFPELCHSCGVCTMVCPEGALVEQPRETGTIGVGHVGALGTLGGRLDVGEARSAPLVRATLEQVTGDDGLVIVDSPPGTSCPAMSSVEGADLVVLVTEPTPFGLHDLALAVGMCRALDLEIAAVVNRSDLGDDKVVAWLADKDIPLLATIPFDLAIARTYAEGGIAAETSPAVRTAVDAILVHAAEVTR